MREIELGFIEKLLHRRRFGLDRHHVAGIQRPVRAWDVVVTALASDSHDDDLPFARCFEITDALASQRRGFTDHQLGRVIINRESIIG